MDCYQSYISSGQLTKDTEESRLEFRRGRKSTMSTSPESLSSELQQFTSELRRLEKRLKSECPPNPVVLNEFRHTVDNVRLTAWSVSELLNAEHIKKNPDTVLAFLSAERL